MRQITKESVNAFLNAKKFNKSNMSVEVLPNVTVLKYHGNEIAYKYNDPDKTISITTCGWFSNTTKERLNGVIKLSGLNIEPIYQKNWNWYLNGKNWDGGLIDLN
jgi:hypothetical protein